MPTKGNRMQKIDEELKKEIEELFQQNLKILI